MQLLGMNGWPRPMEPSTSQDQFELRGRISLDMSCIWMWNFLKEKSLWSFGGNLFERFGLAAGRFGFGALAWMVSMWMDALF